MLHAMRVAALLLAAGRGERLAASVPKAFVALAGRSLLARSSDALAACAAVEWILPVIPVGESERYRALLERELAGASKLLPAVEGGAERQDSVRAGLAALPVEAEWVAVHDAARALVRSQDVARVIAAARSEGAALLAHPISDTVKRVREDRVVETPPRDECWAAQTPQVFRAALLREALAQADAAGFRGTDDASLVERLGQPVRVVPGDPGNRKITDPDDLRWAEARLGRA